MTSSDSVSKPSLLQHPKQRLIIASITTHSHQIVSELGLRGHNNLTFTSRWSFLMIIHALEHYFFEEKVEKQNKE